MFGKVLGYLSVAIILGAKPVDVGSTNAMEKAYYIVIINKKILHYRGYKWDQNNKKKGGKKRGKKK